MLGDRFNNAIKELEDFFINQDVKLRKEGWSWVTTEEPQDNEVLLLDSGKELTISLVGNDTSIFKPMQNMQARFWHDVTHIKMQLGFSVKEEARVIRAQDTELEAAGVSQLARYLFGLDMIGQNLYYEMHGEYVKDQEEFVFNCLVMSEKEALETPV